jgi:hypothetical protein
MAASKRAKLTAPIGPLLLQPDDIPTLRSEFASAQPFPHVHLACPFSPALLDGAAAELLASLSSWTPRGNDLYRFTQSPSLVEFSTPSVSALAAFIYAPAFRALVEGVTGVTGLIDKPDASAALYRHGDRLLCHDDDLATRRVAFVLYLTPGDWGAADGGALELFSVDGAGRPAAVAAALLPARHSMVLFEVTPVSFHQVAEVLREEGGGEGVGRLSISGWFHAAAQPPRPPPAPLLPPVCFARPFASAPAPPGGLGGGSPLFLPAARAAHPPPLERWVSPSYLKPAVAARVRARFLAEGGSLQLPAFLLPERFAEVMRALATAPWRRVGPPVLQSYARALAVCDVAAAAAAGGGGGGGPPLALSRPHGEAPSPVHELLTLLASEPFAKLVGAFTGDVCGEVAGEVRAFAPGDYTLIADPEYLAEAKALRVKKLVCAGEGGNAAAAAAVINPTAGARGATLDVQLLCCLSEQGAWEDAWGGLTTYLTADAEVASVAPAGNVLSLMRMPPKLLSYVSYVTHDAPEPRFDFALSFR